MTPFINVLEANEHAGSYWDPVQSRKTSAGLVSADHDKTRGCFCICITGWGFTAGDDRGEPGCGDANVV